jgi:hypothetical protein
MVMLMIKFGAYKAAGVVGCVLPPFARTTKLMMKALGGEREKKAKNQVSEPLLALSSLLSFFFPQFFPSLSPSPRRRRLFLLCIVLRGGRGRERDAGTTENASVTDDSEQSSDDE